jgi:uncharacterized protein YabN with tetrapyrrole methylase and pyrophosphatase domain
MNYDEFSAHVYKWAEAKGLINLANFEAQIDKIQEEIEELVAAHEWEGPEEQLKEWGDVLVVHTLIGHILEIDAGQAMATVWDKIKNRKGKTIGGQFVKEA